MTCRETLYGLETVLEVLPPAVAGDRTGVEIVVDHAEAQSGSETPLHLRFRGLLDEVEGYDGPVDLEDALGTVMLALTLEQGRGVAQGLLRMVAEAEALRQESLSWVTGGVA